MGGTKPEIRLNSVVLPAPLGPMTAWTPPRLDLEGDVVDGDEARKRRVRASRLRSAFSGAPAHAQAEQAVREEEDGDHDDQAVKTRRTS